jgi:hypothetical protein
LAIGIASVLAGLSILSAGSLRWVLWLAIAQMGGVGCFDAYRNWKLGKHSPFYVGKLKNENDVA